MLDAELDEGPADLGQAPLVDLAAGLGAVEVVAAAVGVEGAEEALLLDRFPKPAKAREGAFFLDQEGRDDLARGVVHGGDEVEVAAQIHQPAVGRAVLEQEHPRQGPARPPLAVRPAPPGLLHKTRLLQADLGPGIAEPEAVAAHQVLVEVLGREVPIARAVLLQDPFDLVKRRAAPRGPPQAPVHKTRRPLGLVAVAKPAKMTLRHPQDLRRLQTAQRAAAIAAQCFCYAHNPYLRIHRYPRFLGTLQETGHIACYTFRTYLVLLTSRPHGLAVVGDHLYVADTSRVWRYAWRAGQTQANGSPEAVTKRGELGSGFGHSTRTLLFDADASHFYVAIGSMANVARENAPRATVMRFKADGTGAEVLAPDCAIPSASQPIRSPAH